MKKARTLRPWARRSDLKGVYSLAGTIGSFDERKFSNANECWAKRFFTSSPTIRSPEEGSVKSSRVIDGKKIANEMLDEIKTKYHKLREKKDFKPHLVLMCVAPPPAVRSYMRQKEEACARVGFSSLVDQYPEDVTEEAVLRQIHTHCNDPQVDGVIVQFPLPKHISLERVCTAIHPEKDVDGVHPYSQGLIVLGQTEGMLPCTPRGIMELFKRTGVDLNHKNCVIVGRSYLVGHPLMSIMQNYQSGKGPTVTLVHRGTRDPSFYLRNADIVVAAAGHPDTIKAEDIKEGAVLIDVGINHIPDASKKSGFRMVGDISREALEKASLYTPVPGGVGPMTVASLVHNTFFCAVKKNELLSDKEMTEWFPPICAPNC